MNNELPSRTSVPPGVAVLRLPALMSWVSLSKSHIYAEIKKGTFPAPIKLGPRASGWLANDVSAWLAARINATRSRSQA